jgi:uncharacterized protein (TIGR00304 family)
VDGTIFFAVGLALIVIGIIIIVSAIFLAAIRGAGKRKVEAAGVIMIGPIPIIFGTNKESVKTVLVLALTLTIVLVIATVIYYLFLR